MPPAGLDRRSQHIRPHLQHTKDSNPGESGCMICLLQLSHGVCPVSQSLQVSIPDATSLTFVWLVPMTRT